MKFGGICIETDNAPRLAESLLQLSLFVEYLRRLRCKFAVLL